MNKRTIIFILVVTFSFIVIQNLFMTPQNTAEKPKELPKITEIVSLPKHESLKNISEEQFFVIENENQQLVFSNLGGAIAEVNLPFHSKKHPDSVIHPVEVDSLLLKEKEICENFPMHPAINSQGKTAPTTFGGYYPLLRRPINKDQNFSPEYYSLQIPEFAHELFRVTLHEKDKIQFSYSSGAKKIVKTYALSKEAPYFVDLWVESSFPENVKTYELNSGMCDVELTSGNFEPQIKICKKIKDSKIKVTHLKLPKNDKSPIKEEPISYEWCALTNGFFGILLDPLSLSERTLISQMIPGYDAPSRITLIGTHDNLYPKDKYPAYQFQITMNAPSKTQHIRLYAGPIQRKLLLLGDKAFSTESSPKNYVDLYSSQGFFSFISVPFAKLLLLLMNLFYFVTHSYGLSIILLTIALRIMLYPLNTWSIKSNARLQAIAPKLKLLQERYKKDPKVLQMETMKLYKGEKVNPISGCFPILIQIPFLIGFFDLLRTSFELRGVSFIPGWISDLSAPDVLFSWNTSIFLIGYQFHLLPILLGIITFLQQKLSMKLPKDPKLLTDQQKQQKMMSTIMPILFTVLFYKMPSGLNIYFLTSTLLGIVQQYFVEKKSHG